MVVRMMNAQVRLCVGVGGGGEGEDTRIVKRFGRQGGWDDVTRGQGGWDDVTRGEGRR